MVKVLGPQCSPVPELILLPANCHVQHLSRFVLIASLLVAAGCSKDSAEQSPAQSAVGQSQPQQTIAVQLNWFPEAEHGGIYQAANDGTFDEAGIDVDIRPGAHATRVDAEVHLGRCQFAVANADDVVLFRDKGMDIVAVLAVAQNHPRCILVQEASGVTDFEGLAGMTLQSQAGRPFLEFLRSKGLLDQVAQRPYHGSVSSLVGDPKIAVQAYSYSEPLLAEQQGVKVRTLMVSELGWNPYSSVLVTSGELIRQQPEMVRQFVEATQQGWQNYLTEPEKGNGAILAANKDGMTPEALEFGSRQLRELAVPDSMEMSQLGMMTRERWQTLIDQMGELELVEADKIKADDCFTTEFLP